MLKLSKRLQTIADRVTNGSRVADIGSDHALLPVYLVQSGKSPSAIAGELNAGPLEAARKQIAAAGLSNAIQARQGDGLSVLSPGEADTVTIAGMGGSLMSDILEAGWTAGRLEGVRELVLQPNVGEELVRRWLVRRGYLLRGEAILEEDGRIYEVLHAAAAGAEEAEAGNRRLYDAAFLPMNFAPGEGAEWLQRMGPYLLRSEETTLEKKWRLELEKLERIRRQLALSELEESRKKADALEDEMKRIEEVLACLPMVK